MAPQFLPCARQVVASQGAVPHWLGPPPPHTWPLGQSPQGRILPQPSEISPHLAPLAAQVVAVQPHTFAMPPPPQVWYAPWQVPQSVVPPQPSGILSQFFPCAAHVVAVQPHTFAIPPPP